MSNVLRNEASWEYLNEGLDAGGHLQHFQASHRSEGSVLDAADVVFIQLAAESTKSREKHLVTKRRSVLPPYPKRLRLFPDPPGWSFTGCASQLTPPHKSAWLHVSASDQTSDGCYKICGAACDGAQADLQPDEHAFTRENQHAHRVLLD